MEFTTRAATWTDDKSALMHVRNIVFVEGQNVPKSLESDEFDSVSRYILAEDSGGNPIGCARLQPTGKVGRIAVLDEYRRHGIARKMLADIIECATREKIHPLYLHAQITAVDLYKQFGFVQDGDQFEEAGIQHIKMTRQMSESTT